MAVSWIRLVIPEGPGGGALPPPLGTAPGGLGAVLRVRRPGALVGVPHPLRGRARPLVADAHQPHERRAQRRTWRGCGSALKPPLLVLIGRPHDPRTPQKTRLATRLFRLGSPLCFQSTPVAAKKPRTRGVTRLVGARGFEPPTSWSRTTRSSQAEPRPDREGAATLSRATEDRQARPLRRPGLRCPPA